jgi:chitinase
VRIYNRALSQTEIQTAMNTPISGATANKPPTVTLTAPANGATYTAPATMTLTATASDPENALARVEFYSGTTLLGTDTTSPYSFSWGSVAAGTYSVRAIAYDAAGASATSVANTIVVSTTTTTTPPRAVVFHASADHATLVTRYELRIFASGANPLTATPLTTSDLGKPTPDAAGDITVDRATFFSNLAVGSYVAAVSAIGSGGSSLSTGVTFTR